MKQGKYRLLGTSLLLKGRDINTPARIPAGGSGREGKQRWI